MTVNIFLAARPALGLELLGSGHLYFILWDDVNLVGRTVSANQIIGVGLLEGRIDLTNEDPDNLDGFDANQFPTLNTINITSLLGGSVNAAWNNIVTVAQGIDAVQYTYDYVSGALDLTEPAVNSNSFVFTILNALGINPPDLISQVADDHEFGRRLQAAQAATANVSVAKPA